MTYFLVVLKGKRKHKVSKISVVFSHIVLSQSTVKASSA